MVSGSLFDEELATLTGWGRHKSDSPSTSPILKEYTAPVVPLGECLRRWENYTALQPRDSNLCLDVTWASPCHVRT